MNIKCVIATVVIIALIASVAFVYQGQTIAQLNAQITELQAEIAHLRQLEALHNLVDDTGITTSLDALPNRIASIAPSNTEILFALGLGDKVVAVSDVCDYPYNFSAWVAAGNMTSIVYSNPNVEAIVSLDADLILATGGVQAEAVDTLRSLGQKVLVLYPTEVDGVLKDIELVGNATGKTAEAKALVANLTSRINAVVDKVANAASTPKVYYEVWYDPIYTAGAKAWQNALFAKAGGVNVFADQDFAYFQTSDEAVIERNPDVIVLPKEGMGTQFWGSLDDVKARPGWSSISAVQNDRICLVDSSTIARAGPRVADIIEDLAEAFHPELF